MGDSSRKWWLPGSQNPGPATERGQGSGAEGGLVAREPDGPAGAISMGLTIKQRPGKQTPSLNPHPRSAEG